MDADSQAASAQKALQALQSSVQAVSKGKRDEQLKHIAECERLAQRVRHALDSYRLETRGLPKEELGEHNNKLRSIEEGLKQCRTEIDWKKYNVATPPDTSSHYTGASGGDVESSEMTTQQAAQIAEETQNASMDSCARMKKSLATSEEIGIATLDKMYAQNEQLDRIAEDNEDIKANLKRSKKILGQIARNAASDRCVQMICLLITIAVVVMVILAMLGKDGGALNVPDEVRQMGKGGSSAPAPAPAPVPEPVPAQRRLRG